MSEPIFPTEARVDERCGTCKFCLLPSVEFAYGICRRYPPTVIVNLEGTTESEQPDVHLQIWCGEWQRRES